MAVGTDEYFSAVPNSQKYHCEPPILLRRRGYPHFGGQNRTKREIALGKTPSQ